MQSNLGRQKRDKRPLISSVPLPTASFCRLQGLVSSWQLNGLGSQLHKDPLIPMGNLSPPRAGWLSVPHSIWDTPRLPWPCSACPILQGSPTTMSSAGSTGPGKGALALPATSPSAALQAWDRAGRRNTWTPQATNKHIWLVELLVSDAHLHMELKLLTCWGKFHFKSYFSKLMCWYSCRGTRLLQRFAGIEN